mgnify:CR=1 FL=1
MKDWRVVSIWGAVLAFTGLLLATAVGQNPSEAQERYRLVDILSMGDNVALDPLADNTRIIVVPDESFWQQSDRQRGGFERGVVTGVYDDYVSIRVVNELAVDPLGQGKTKIAHIPAHAIARITTFTDTKY